MRLFEIAYPDENNNDIVEILTEEEVLKSYYDYWCSRMKEIGKESEISIDSCIEDWKIIHWALEIRVPI